MIDTATNTVVNSIPVGVNPAEVAIIPSIVSISSFSTFIAKIDINRIRGDFELYAAFTLGRTTNGIKPLTEAVTLSIDKFTTSIQPGSFRMLRNGNFEFDGTVNGVELKVIIQPLGRNKFAFMADARGVKLSGTAIKVPVTITIGDDSGKTSAK